MPLKVRSVLGSSSLPASLAASSMEIVCAKSLSGVSVSSQHEPFGQKLVVPQLVTGPYTGSVSWAGVPQPA